MEPMCVLTVKLAVYIYIANGCCAGNTLVMFIISFYQRQHKSEFAFRPLFPNYSGDTVRSLA